MKASHAAARIRRIVLAMPQAQDNTLFDLWKRVFLLADLDEEGAEKAVPQCLAEFRRQLEFVSAALDERGVPKDLFERQFRKLLQIASSKLLSSGASGQVGNATSPDVPLALGWAALVLGGTADSLSNDDVDQAKLADLLAEVRDTAKRIRETESMNALLRRFLLERLADFEASIHMAPVMGIEALAAAVDRTVGEIVTEGEPLRDAPITPETKTLLRKFQAAFDRAAEMSGKADKIASLLQKIGKGGATLLGYIKDLV